MHPNIPRRRAEDPARRQEAARHVSTAKDLLSGQTTGGKIERCRDLLIKALGLDPCATGGRALLVAANALRATHRNRLPAGAPNPCTVFGLIPNVPAARDLALIESYYRQASDLLSRYSKPLHPCYRAFSNAARLVADAWAFLSDPERKAVLDSAYEAFEVAEKMPKRPIDDEKAAEKAAPAAKRQKELSSNDDDGNSEESAIDLEKLDRFSKVQQETNANRIKELELEQKLSSEKLETTKLAHLTAQEAKEQKKLILKAKKIEKESKMMDAYNNLTSQDTSLMCNEEKAERVVAMKCLRKALFPETI